MPGRENVKEKVKKIVKVLPELNCGKCGLDNCGKFARAVAEEKTPCYGCISGGPSVANKVCEIMGVGVPGIAGDPMNRGRGRSFGQNQVRRGPGGGKGFGRRRGRAVSKGRSR